MLATMHKRQPATSALLYFIKMTIIYLITLFSIYYTVILLGSLAELSQLSKHDDDATPSSPSLPPSLIPRKLWYVLEQQDMMDDETRHRMSTCIEAHPHHDVHILAMTQEDASSADDLVRTAFAIDRPDLVDGYLGLASLPVLQAAVLRYLILYAEGGVMIMGSDVSCEVRGSGDDDAQSSSAMDEWLPKPYRDRAGLVVVERAGKKEEEEEEATTEANGRKRAVIMARPRSPHVLMAIDYILYELREKTEELHVDDISDLTGSAVEEILDLARPKRFIENVLKRLGSSSLKKGMAAEHDTILIEDVLIIPNHPNSKPTRNKGPQDLK